MQCQNPYKILDINVEQIYYKNIKESDNKKIIFIKYKENLLKNMVFQLPTINNNFNLDDREIDIIIDSEYENKSSNIINFFNLIDSKIVKDAKKNVNSWFDHIEDKTQVNYHHILRTNQDNNYSLKLKIIDSKDFKTNLILNNDDENQIQLDNLPNEGKLKLVLECYAVWIQDNNFGLILRPIIISFIMNIDNNYNYKILDDSESDESDDSNNEELFIKPSEINNSNININLNESLTNTSSSNINENNLNKLIFNFKNI
jgi:hypothetical protein